MRTIPQPEIEVINIMNGFKVYKLFDVLWSS